MAIDIAALRDRVNALQFRGDPSAPELAHELVAAVVDESGEDSLAAAEALDLLASTYLARGDGPRAIRFFSQALRVGRGAGEGAAALAIRTSFLAYAHLLRGDHEPAQEEADRALTLAAEVPGAARAKVAGNAAAIFGTAKRLDRAAELYAEVDTLLGPVDEGEGDAALEACTDRATAAIGLGRTELDRNRLDEAAGALWHALDLLERMRRLQLRPTDAQVSNLRATWSDLAARHPVEAARRATFEARSSALDGPLAPAG